ncbi:MAG: WYL domain-containing protein [Reyranella sp.]|uniref:helix-turn-helix transcriptional regulator n=1 Tax=Reyranella sp. TaxID=1929291 RepID=UPI0011F5FB59|nr:WYL domain-containing protein [Reyranella sp.]TAJ36864.1 MAG: WYL domain-containing protein [Reyranella sp.]
MAGGHDRLRWGIGQRIEFIEFRLFWDGQINRGDLIGKFDVSPPQASADIARYLQMAPDNLRYDPYLKTYAATHAFQPLLYEPSARQYLGDLRSIADHAREQKETWLGFVPEFAAVPAPRRRLDAGKLRWVVEAIRAKQSLCVLYQSFSRVEPLSRWVTPHALGFDGSRWHLRAWCHEHNDFRDFVLARILEISESRHHPIDPTHDLAWNKHVSLRIGPHPKLGEKQRRVIELDYGMEGGALEIPIRLSMVYYFEKNMLLDEDASALTPTRVQLSLVNRVELEKMVEVTRQEQQELLRKVSGSAGKATE